MGGQVSPSGAAAYSERGVTGNLSLMSSNRDFAVKECRFTPDLELELKNAGKVADLLRHRSLTTTQIYAKLDTPKLSIVVLPWPGSAS